MYLFDTDHLSLLQDGSERGKRIQARVVSIPRDRFFISIISFQEQTKGWNAYINKAQKPDELIRGHQMLRTLLYGYASANILDFSHAAVGRFQTLTILKNKVGTLDLRIASIALMHNCTVLTRNIKDFRHIPGLRIEDWSQ